MKVVVLGTRGIPDIQGGVETHCEALYPLLVSRGVDVTLMLRRPYRKKSGNLFQGVKLLSLYAPRSKSLEAIVHSFLALLRARTLRPDLLHFHAIGPALLIPLARLLGHFCLFTHHGYDYQRKKWGGLARAVLRLGEIMGMRFAHAVIAISKPLAEDLKSRFPRQDITYIPNGVALPARSREWNHLKALGLRPDRYLFALGRFVPEKGFHDLVRAYGEISQPKWPLVLAGEADHPSVYSDNLLRSARSQGVRLTGFIRGERLRQLFSRAGIFVLPSYHEGLSIALLEAISHSRPVLASDIQANLQLNLGRKYFFPVGDWLALKKKLERWMKKIPPAPRSLAWVKKNYSWDTAADRVFEKYNWLLTKRG